MGLDVALGVIVLIAAIRGWLQGFVYQVIRIAGLVACVYLATPVRDHAKPYVLPYLPTIQPDLVDRLLWWVSASVSYVLLVGLATLVIKMTRRPEIPGIPQSTRNDQFAGFLMGISKGVLVAAFLTAGIQNYARSQIATVAWADEQVKTSMALRWNEQYQPAAKIWSSVPVRHFVSQIQRMGLQNPADGPAHPDQKSAEHPVVQTEKRAPEWDLAGSAKPPIAPPSPAAIPPAKRAAKSGADPDVEKAVEEAKATLDAADKRSN
jgi:uncharacterized membrane protein required for colicin V production